MHIIFILCLNQIIILSFLNNQRYVGSPRKVETPGDGTILSEGSYSRLAMDGKEVYKFATREVPTVIQEALEAADMTVEDVDWLLLHQVSFDNFDACVNSSFESTIHFHPLILM